MIDDDEKRARTLLAQRIEIHEAAAGIERSRFPGSVEVLRDFSMPVARQSWEGIAVEAIKAGEARGHSAERQRIVGILDSLAECFHHPLSWALTLLAKQLEEPNAAQVRFEEAEPAPTVEDPSLYRSLAAAAPAPEPTGESFAAGFAAGIEAAANMADQLGGDRPDFVIRDKQDQVIRAQHVRAKSIAKAIRHLTPRPGPGPMVEQIAIRGSSVAETMERLRRQSPQPKAGE